MTMKRKLDPAALSMAVVLCLAVSPVGAQSVLEYPDARVEIRGLKQWTTEMLIDSMRVHAPDTRLASHACAAVLRRQLGFADASVMIFPKGWEGRTRQEFVINLVEPQDSARVQYPGARPDSLPDRAEWAGVRALFDRDPGAFQRALRDPRIVLADARPDSALQPAGSVAAELHAFLFTHRSDEDLQLAVQTLARDRNSENRMVAAVLLVSFPDRDAAWHALADALRDPVALVSGMAMHAVHSMRTGAARSVDWDPAVPVLRALLNGTQLFAFDLVLDVLVDTADGEWVRTTLLPGWDDTITLHMLQSIDPAARERADRFLTHVRGTRPADGSQNGWRQWLQEAAGSR